jgi:hypothetical protein
MRFHRHEHVHVEAPAAPSVASLAEPLVAAVWQDGLSHATPSGGLVIHAPHASELLAAPKSAHLDAA